MSQKNGKTNKNKSAINVGISKKDAPTIAITYKIIVIIKSMPNCLTKKTKPSVALIGSSFLVLMTIFINGGMQIIKLINTAKPDKYSGIKTSSDQLK